MAKDTKYNRFDRSFSSKFSTGFDGILYPVFYDEVLPGDKFSVKMASLVRVVPLLAPLMDAVHFDVHFFFVPNRLVWSQWEPFITGGNRGKSVVTAPYIEFTTIKDKLLSSVKARKRRCMQHSTLCDYFDVPTFSDTDQYEEGKAILQPDTTAPAEANLRVRVSALPYRAYDLIWLHFYRDEWQQYIGDYNAEINYAGGLDDTTLCEFRWRNWKRDYFTSLLPLPQKTLIGSDLPSGEGFYDMTLSGAKIKSPGAQAPVTQGVVPSMKVSTGTVPQIRITAETLNNLGFQIQGSDGTPYHLPFYVDELSNVAEKDVILPDSKLDIPSMQVFANDFSIKVHPQAIVLPALPVLLRTGTDSPLRVLVPELVVKIPDQYVVNLENCWLDFYAGAYDPSVFPEWVTRLELHTFQRDRTDDIADYWQMDEDPTHPQPSIIYPDFASSSLDLKFLDTKSGKYIHTFFTLGWTVGADKGRLKTPVNGTVDDNSRYGNCRYRAGLRWNPACVSTLHFETPHYTSSSKSVPLYSPIKVPLFGQDMPKTLAVDVKTSSNDGATLKRVEPAALKKDGDTEPTIFTFEKGIQIAYEKETDGSISFTIPKAQYTIPGYSFKVPAGTNLGAFTGLCDTRNWKIITHQNLYIPERDVSDQTTPQTEINSQVAQVPDAVGLNINELRAAFKVQRYMEKAAIIGSRYPEYLWGHFKVKSPDARLQRPEYLGGGSFQMAFSEVLQTAPTDSYPLGSYAGHGLAAEKGIGFKRYFSEHGMIFGLMSMRLRSAYAQGIPRMHQRWNKFAYYHPIFAHLGEEPVFLRELIIGMNHKDDSMADNDPVSQKVLGWKDRFDEYRHRYNTFHGLLRSSLVYWHLGRVFQTLKKTDPVPKLEELISTHNFYADSAGGSSYPTRVFANKDTFDDKFIFDTHFRVKVLRKMPKKGNPGDVL